MEATVWFIFFFYSTKTTKNKEKKMTSNTLSPFVRFYPKRMMTNNRIPI